MARMAIINGQNGNTKGIMAIMAMIMAILAMIMAIMAIIMAIMANTNGNNNGHKLQC